jgi:hypothetical protein
MTHAVALSILPDLGSVGRFGVCSNAAGEGDPLGTRPVP